jgi:hypothetical protein
MNESLESETDRPDAEPPVSHPASSDGGWLGVLIPSLVAALVGGLAGWWAATQQAPTPLSGAGEQGAVVVMDNAAWLEAARDGEYGLERENIAERMESVATTLRAQGAIVLYGDAVMTSPSTRRIGPEVLDEVGQ